MSFVSPGPSVPLSSSLSSSTVAVITWSLVAVLLLTVLTIIAWSRSSHLTKRRSDDDITITIIIIGWGFCRLFLLHIELDFGLRF